MFGFIPVIVIISSFFKNVFEGIKESCFINETVAPVSIKNLRGLLEFLDLKEIVRCDNSEFTLLIWC